MFDPSSEPLPRRSRWGFALLPVLALALGGAFFWSYRNSLSSPENEGRARRHFAGNASARPSTSPRFMLRRATPAERAEAIATINGQLIAFKAHDWNKSMLYRVRRGTPDEAQRFGQMILQSYPLFANFERVEFGPSTCLDDKIQVPIRLIGRKRTVVYASYMLQKEDGIYRVATVSGGMGGQGGMHSDGRSEEDDMGGGDLVS